MTLILTTTAENSLAQFTLCFCNGVIIETCQQGVLRPLARRQIVLFILIDLTELEEENFQPPIVLTAGEWKMSSIHFHLCTPKPYSFCDQN